MQASDVVWNKPFKQKVPEVFEEWLDGIFMTSQALVT